MMGNWTIIEEDFSGDFLGKYQLMLLPHESEDALIGKIYVVKTRRIIEKNNITLRFSGENREVFSLFFGKQEITTVNFSIGNNLLLQAFGSTQYGTYSAVMQTNTNLLITIVSKESKRLINMIKVDTMIKDKSGIMGQYLPLLMIALYFINRRKKNPE